MRVVLEEMSQAFKPKKFEKPKTLEEASDILRKYGERARIISGGTGIYEIAYRGLLSDIEALVDISGLGLDHIEVRDAILRIGACTTMSDLLDSSVLANIPSIMIVRDALKLIQPLQVKNVASIAGSICTAVPFFDLPVALIALDAVVRKYPSNESERISEFIQGFFSVNLAPGEFVQEINIPLSSTDEFVGSAFEKFALTGDDWAIVNCGAWVKMRKEPELNISDVHLCFGGGIGEKPKRALESEKALAGVKYDESSLKSILESSLSKEIETTTDIRASSEYRLKLAKVLCRRAIVSAADRAMRRRI